MYSGGTKTNKNKTKKHNDTDDVAKSELLCISLMWLKPIIIIIIMWFKTR